LDAARIDTMCLIEFPEWGAGGLELLSERAAEFDTGVQVHEFLQDMQHLQDKVELLHDETGYGSIGAFYNAVKIGVWKFYEELRPRNQIDDFRRYYADLKNLTVDKTGTDGLLQVWELLTVITDQGEGQNAGGEQVAREHRNTATDPSPGVDHYGKFLRVRAAAQLPDTYRPAANPGSTASDAQETLAENFTAFRSALEHRFAGEHVPDFWEQMATLGANIRTCWARGTVPQFSLISLGERSR
jgi:hypothetical protein